MRLLAVDDSALMRRLLAEIFAGYPEVSLTFARNGIEALALLNEIKPDVVTLDIHMPEMDGLACLDRIMVERPCPVVMFSSLTAEGATETLEALSLGAVDFMVKPGGAISLKLSEFGPLLVEKVFAAAKARLPRSHRLSERIRLRSGRVDPPPSALPQPPPQPQPQPQPRKSMPAGDRLVLVGCSTGGPPALDALLEPLPADFPCPIVIAQHMPASFTGALAARLDRQCAVEVIEIDRPTPLLAGRVHVAHGDADIIVSRRRGTLTASSVPQDPALRWHPSVDRLVDSALAATSPEALIGILMTGMGHDGAAAMTRLRQQGGRTIAEAEETAIVWGMPGELVRTGGAEFTLPLPDIAEVLLRLAEAP